MAASPSGPTAAVPPSTPPPAVEAAPASRPRVRSGDVSTVSAERFGPGARLALLELPDEPRPTGSIVGYAEGHHAHFVFREIASEEVPAAPIVVLEEGSVCETHATAARRLHGVFVSDDDDHEEIRETTFRALELEGCRSGATAIFGITAADVVVHRMDRTQLEARAPVELVDLVRERDSEFGDPVAAADFRLLPLPELDITIVVGNYGHVVRGGRELHDRWFGLIESVLVAGDYAVFELDSPSEGWSDGLECFHPMFLAAPCELVDPSGTPTNVRAGPSGRSPVVTTLESDARPMADDHVGSWYHVTSTPAGWVHESALHCEPLPEGPRDCD